MNITIKTTSRPCPICDERSADALLHLPFALPEGSPLPDAYDVVACRSCGFVYADTPVAQPEYDRYYHEHSKYEDPLVATGGSQTAHDRSRIAAQADRIRQRISADARILDIGCAGGGLLLALRERGCHDLVGVDGAAACIAALSLQGIIAIEAPLSTLGAAGLRPEYDLIILSHVLEHVVDLRPLLQAVRALLAPGGAIYVETPDASSYPGHVFVPYYFFDSEHINHFDPESIAALARVCGLAPADAGRTEFAVADGLTYPACWSWLNGVANTAPEAPDTGTGLRAAIEHYLAESVARENATPLATLAASGQPLVLWGAGSHAQRLFGQGLLGRCNIVAIVDRDSNKQGMLFAGHRVQPPESVPLPDGAIIAVAAAVHFGTIAHDAASIWPGCTVITLAGDTNGR